MSSPLKDVRIPGFAWAMGIIVIVGLIHTYGPQYGFSPLYIDMAVAILIGVLKGLNLGTDQLDQAIKIIDLLLMKEVAEVEGIPRGPAAVPRINLTDIPDKPNKTVRFFLG